MTRSQIATRNSKIVIAGAGPAGSSLAIRLAQLGFPTTLIERERFPRPKLCGEFISPECFAHFDELGVLDEMFSAGGNRITETRFFESGGRSVSVPSSWFGQGEFALSLSRAEMDHRLLERASRVGVSILEGTSVTGIEADEDRIVGLSVRRSDGQTRQISGDVFVDATGRSSVLSRLRGRRSQAGSPRAKPGLIGFKTHLKTADIPDGVCEIYSFNGGYAGLSPIERERFNICFLIKASTVRSVSSNADEIVRQLIRQNKRAAMTLNDATAGNEWLAVAIDGFGRQKSWTAENLFTIGDAASFIDPFTGSGMFMAFQSAAVLADSIAGSPENPELISASYHAAYKRTFTARHRICSVLRKTAFMPTVATAIVTALSLSSSASRRLARATRG